MKQSLIYVAVLLLSLCSTASAKKKTDNPETVKLKNKIENVMLKVDAQPDWLYSRLQMFWNTHATDVFINGERFDHPGGERAAEPTVKYNGTRGTESQYNRPKLEDILPYDDDEQGNVTYINKVTGKMEKTSPAKTKFVTKIEDEKVIEAMNGQRKITMTMWMKVDTNRVWTKGMKVINVSRRSEDNTWKPTYGEYAQIRDHYNEMTIHLMKGGISGIKFGFVQIGSQEWTTWLHRAVRKCADHHIMVDIHDEYRPTGWSRTYPNLMTQEGIGGNEDDLPNVYKGETPRSIHAPMCRLPS